MNKPEGECCELISESFTCGTLDCSDGLSTEMRYNKRTGVIVVNVQGPIHDPQLTRHLEGVALTVSDGCGKIFENRKYRFSRVLEDGWHEYLPVDEPPVPPA